LSRNRTNLGAKPVGCVDACIVIGFAEQDIGAEELAALDQLFALQGDGRIVLASSYVTEEEVVQEEVARVSDQTRSRHKAMAVRLEALPKLAEVTPQVTTNAAGRSHPVGPLPDAGLTTLAELLRDEPDRRHVFQAVKHGADYFVTVDGGSLRASEIESFTRPRFCARPIESTS
jgi:hypothetical protein